MLGEIFGLDGIVVLVVVVVVLFGGTQIPKLARSLGSAQREFKSGQREGSTTEVPAEASDAGPSKPPVGHLNSP